MDLWAADMVGAAGGALGLAGPRAHEPAMDPLSFTVLMAVPHIEGVPLPVVDFRALVDPSVSNVAVGLMQDLAAANVLLSEVQEGVEGMSPLLGDMLQPPPVIDGSATAAPPADAAAHAESLGQRVLRCLQGEQVLTDRLYMYASFLHRARWPRLGTRQAYDDIKVIFSKVLDHGMYFELLENLASRLESRVMMHPNVRTTIDVALGEKSTRFIERVHYVNHIKHDRERMRKDMTSFLHFWFNTAAERTEWLTQQTGYESLDSLAAGLNPFDSFTFFYLKDSVDLTMRILIAVHKTQDKSGLIATGYLADLERRTLDVPAKNASIVTMLKMPDSDVDEVQELQDKRDAPRYHLVNATEDDGLFTTDSWDAFAVLLRGIEDEIIKLSQDTSALTAALSTQGSLGYFPHGRRDYTHMLLENLLENLRMTMTGISGKEQLVAALDKLIKLKDWGPAE